MSTQGAVKHSATDSSQTGSKRERRRGAAGRASALRRAPSDSDCSVETASLSADSGDRVVRPKPPTTRTTRSSRRRGSEWEVLEGLKDGQRFEKRPEVFNGYLHKKRKWPLKGWHKRFFVVDGGILVYARSPTDVARGRLHGSVDVGLSVISAKARRRRIDIDADEFIYHLRAKTPDTFRTWLVVLKAHRLYRQHLLTFGAREPVQSVPKIHATIDELPPTETSSRSTLTNDTMTLSSSSEELIEKSYHSCSRSISDQNNELTSALHSLYDQINQNPVGDWPIGSKSEIDPIPEPVNKALDTISILYQKSLCSMKCLQRKKATKLKTSKATLNNSSIIEKTIATADLNKSNNRSSVSTICCEYTLNSPNIKNISFEKTISANKKADAQFKAINEKEEGNKYMSTNKKHKPTSAYFFSILKRGFREGVTPMKRSLKSTNLVKYRNFHPQPTTQRPPSRCILIGSYYKQKKICETEVTCHKPIIKNNETQVEIENDNKSLQNVISMTPSECDAITQNLIVSIFKKSSYNNLTNKDELLYCVNQAVTELYDFKMRASKVKQIQFLFKTLLEYWLKNTSGKKFKSLTNVAKSVNLQSHDFFTRDKNTSSKFIKFANKRTQFNGTSNSIAAHNSECTKTKPTLETKAKVLTDRKKLLPLKTSKSEKKHRAAKFSDSFGKDQRIQQQERFLKNTVYMCETICDNNYKKDKDIKITKTLIDNFDKLSKKSDLPICQGTKKAEGSSSSAELCKIQETFHHLLSETSLSADLAKDIFSIYLDVLQNKSSIKTSTKSSKSTLTSSSIEEEFRKILTCDVQAKAIQNKISKTVTASTNGDLESKSHIDSGQLYLKSVIDKIITMFGKTSCSDYQNKSKILNKVPKVEDDSNALNTKPDYYSTAISLSQMDVQDLSMINEPDSKEQELLSIKVKEKPKKIEEFEKRNLNVKRSGSEQLFSNIQEHWLPIYKNNNLTTTNILSYDIQGNTYLHLNPESGIVDILPYTSQSNSTLEELGQLQKIECNAYNNKMQSDTSQTCFIISSIKNVSLASKQSAQGQSSKKLQQDDNHSHNLNTSFNLTAFNKTPKLIDDKFVLLLLENLSELSKNTPKMHGDINSLFFKLKKKYDKENHQALSLLGNIYKDYNLNCTDNETQCVLPEKESSGNNVTVSTNTSYNLLEVKTLVKSVLIKPFTDVKSTMALYWDFTDTCDIGAQTDIPRDMIFLYDNDIMNLKVPKAAHVNTDYKLRKFSFEKATNTQHYSPTTKKKRINKKEKQNPQYWCIDQMKRKINLEKSSTDVQSKRIRNEPNKMYNFFQGIPSHENKTNVTKINKVYETKETVKLHTNNSDTDSNLKMEKSDDLKTIYRCVSEPSFISGLISPSAAIRGPQASFVSGTPGGRLASWMIESGGPLETASRELGQCQQSVQQLQRLLDTLELHQQAHHDTDVSLDGASPNVKKDRRKFGLRKKKSNSKCASVELALPQHIDPSNSHMALSALTAPPSPGGGASSVPNSAASLPIACAAARPQSLPGAEALGGVGGPASMTSLTPDHQIREDFLVLAKDLVHALKGVCNTLVCERGRLRAAMDTADSAASPGGAMVAALRNNLSTALQQNSDLRSRLSRIHDASDLAEISSVGNGNNTEKQNRQFQQSLSYSSSCVSASEFFDAEDYDEEDELKQNDAAGVIELDGDSSSEAGSLSSEEGGSVSSDNSEGALLSAEPASIGLSHNGGGVHSGWSRRNFLPATRPTPGGPSLWNLLYKNIGKDLSQISMPVTINEPLNMLQRLCEELEYSELLDSASDCVDAMERMALIAAFAVSAYASSAHRAASKPFNPLLAESYECSREDKGFRFIAEQVSHHPPISACHAESQNWRFWQEARIKTKFWGKSMEFQPCGRVHVKLKNGDHYSWNKVTTCVHNLFGGQRWVDQYGDMHIVCYGSTICCKLNFVKASNWSSSRHEVRGAITNSSTGERVRLQGRWSEALYVGEPPAARCLWRPGAMPPEHELYYGFTRFAMQLNELEPGMRDALPHTDTRFRPDQRALEEGDVDAAERHKYALEQAQRDRRRDEPDHIPCWFRKTYEEGEETWVFNGEYWKAREAGFPDHVAPKLW